MPATSSSTISRPARRNSCSRSAWSLMVIVARQAEPQRLGQAVHRIGGEHTGARAAGGARRALICLTVASSAGIGGDHHRIDRINLCSDSAVFPASMGPPETNTTGMFSRMAALSMPGVILSQLEIHHRIGAVCVDHILNRIGNQVSRGKL